jgi:hypothetical protein
MSFDPKDFGLDGIDTAQGGWGIYVQTVVESKDKEKLLLVCIC